MGDDVRGRSECCRDDGVSCSERRGDSFAAGAYGAAVDELHNGSDSHPERYVIGKPHPDRARQFKPFAALKGYYELLEEREGEVHPSPTHPIR